MITKESKEQVKEVLKEIEQDKVHERIHSEIRKNMLRRVRDNPGMYAMCTCGMCDTTFTQLPILPISGARYSE